MLCKSSFLIDSRLYYALLFVFFVLIMLWTIDEFEDDLLDIILGFIALSICSGAIAYNIYLVSFKHVCPLCGLTLGKYGETVSRQIPAM